MPISKTTKRTTRRSPASDIAASKGEAQRDGLRRYLAKQCPECHHRVRLLLPDHPDGTCERCLIVASLGYEPEYSTDQERRRARDLAAATLRGPAAYQVDPDAISRLTQSEEDQWQTQFAKIKERAQGAVGLFLAALEDAPELLRRAILWAPGTSHPWSRDMILLIQDVQMFGDLGSYLGDLASAVDVHLSGDPIGTATIRFLTGIDWRSDWITPGQLEDARGRAIMTEKSYREWIKNTSGQKIPGPGHTFVHVDYHPEDRALVERFKQEQAERVELMDTVYRSDLRRWERGVDTLERDSNDYRLALFMKPKAPEGYYRRLEAWKLIKTRDAEIAAIFRRAEQRRAAAAARQPQSRPTPA